MKKIKLICIIAFSATATIYIGCTKSTTATTTTTSGPLSLTVTVSPALDTINGVAEQASFWGGLGFIT